MDQIERQMIAIVNINHDIKAMADRLNTISARRKVKGKKR